MNEVSEAIEAVLEENKSGVLLVSGTRVPLDTVVFAFNEGASPEEIVLQYPTLNLVQVYGVIHYYLRHRNEIENYLRQREDKHAEFQREAEARWNPQGIRETLLARQKDLLEQQGNS
jgi:uncharacterized protein (DUF433 family)